jgi:hypothetical protein
MNWNRGLFRAWLFISLLWMACVAGVAAVNWYNDPWRPIREVRAPAGALPSFDAMPDESQHEIPPFVLPSDVATKPTGTVADMLRAAPAPPERASGPAPANGPPNPQIPHDQFDPSRAVPIDETVFHWWIYLEIASGVPALLFAVGFGALWTVRGFGYESKSN